MIDRALQREILNDMRTVYPDKYCKKAPDQYDHQIINFNLMYLQEHGLIERAQFGNAFILDDEHEDSGIAIQGKITAAGIDFLENDGGLTAILGVVTIKFHQDTLNELETMIQLDKTLPTEEKATLLQKLRNLPEEGAKTLVQELVKAGLQKAPDGWNTAIHYLNNIPWGQTPAG